MSIVCNLIDLAASYLELFVLYEIYTELFEKNRRKNDLKNAKLWVVFVGTIVIALCNHVSVFSYFI